jgi:hypothetical protein
MSNVNDPLDQAIRIDDVDDRAIDGVVAKSGGRISEDDLGDDLDENDAMLDEVESGLRLADSEFEGVSVGLLGEDVDPDLVQFDGYGNIVMKKAGANKKKTGDDEFDDDDTSVLFDEE